MNVYVDRHLFGLRLMFIKKRPEICTIHGWQRYILRDGRASTDMRRCRVEQKKRGMPCGDVRGEQIKTN
jgi:hypothetical protein